MPERLNISLKRRPPLPLCFGSQEQADGGAHTRQRYFLLVDRECRAYNRHDSWSSIRGCLRGRRWNQGALRGEPAQYDYGLSKPIGEARSPA